MDIICVTQRSLCKDFLSQLEKIAEAKPKFIILREKDLNEKEYTSLTLSALEICKPYNVPVLCNTFYNAAKKTKAQGIHMPLHLAESCKGKEFQHFGISVHSLSEALQAQNLGADYITYGHIFATDCKKGLAPRGTEELAQICRTLTIPVYAIGGITPRNAGLVIGAGAMGICLMSSLMKAPNPKQLMKSF